MANSSGYGPRPGGGGGGGGRDREGARPSPSGRQPQRPQRPPQPRASKTGFVYRERSPDALKQRAERHGQRYDSFFKPGFGVWKPKQGANVIRFLPPTWDDAEHYGLSFFGHSWVGPDQGSYLCLWKMLEKPCPICRIADDARQAGDEDEARQYAPGERVLAWVLDREGDDPFKPLLWNMSWSQDRDIAALCKNRKTGAPLWIDQPDVGFDVSFERTGTTMKNTKYIAYQIDRDPTPIAADMRTQDNVIQFVLDNPLPTVLQYYPAEYLSKAMMGTTQTTADAEPSTLLSEDEEEEGSYAETTEDYEDTGEGEEAPWSDPDAEEVEPDPEPEPPRFRDRLRPQDEAPIERKQLRPRPPTPGRR